jgi:hypothetical protein
MPHLLNQWLNVGVKFFGHKDRLIIHYFWQLKGNLLEPVFYAILIVILLAFRVAVW